MNTKRIRLISAALFLVICLTDCVKKTSPMATEDSSSTQNLNDTIQNNAVELGMNKFDLATEYTNMASGSNGTTAFGQVNRAMGLKAIIDARNYGATFFRVAITGYAPSAWNLPSDIDLWVSNPTAYWADLDQMMSDLAANGMRIAPTFAWNILQFPSMSNTDTITDFITNTNSASYQLMAKYITQFVTRYKNNPAIIFYELGNEMNLSADLDLPTRCLSNDNGDASNCDAEGYYTTDQLITFMQNEAALIRSIDPNHPISSGNAYPRQAAEHIRAMPEWITGSTDFTADTLSQFVTNLTEVNGAVDLVSVHTYDGEDRDFSGQTYRSGNVTIEGQDYTGTEPIPLANQIVTQIMNKKLYVGEYGNSDGSTPTSGDYAWQVTDTVNSLKIPYSSPWIFEFYQFSISQVPDLFHLEEGYSDSYLQHYQSVSAQLGDVVIPSGVDVTPPQVILTWPLTGTVVSSSQLLFAVASDNSGTVTRVDFLLDGNVINSIYNPPYQMNETTSQWTQGTHTLSAVAYDPSGNSSISSVTITANTGIVPTKPTATPTPTPKPTATPTPMPTAMPTPTSPPTSTTAPAISGVVYGGAAYSNSYLNISGTNFQASGNTAQYNCGAGWMAASPGGQDTTFIQISFPGTMTTRTCSVQVMSNGMSSNIYSNISLPSAWPTITSVQEGGTAGGSTYLNVIGINFETDGNTAQYDCGAGWMAASPAGSGGQNTAFVQISFPSAAAGSGPRTCQVEIMSFGLTSNIFTVNSVP